MANIHRVQIRWAGWAGAPGYTNFYLSDLSATISPFMTMLAIWDNYIPAGITLAVPSVGDTIEDSTGEIVGSWSSTGGGLITGGGAGSYTGAGGALIQWRTAVPVDGRRPMGKTYMVPLIVTVYDSVGTLSTTFLNDVNPAVEALRVAYAGDLVVWTRPREATPSLPARAGSSQPCVSASVPDRMTVLRSRRQ